MTRLEAAKARVQGQCKFARIHEHEACKGPEHVMQELQRVEALGGEGASFFRSPLLVVFWCSLAPELGGLGHGPSL